MTICTVDECDKPINAKGLCWKHYMRQRRNGSPDIVLRKHHVVNQNDTQRECRTCLRWLSFDEFHSHNRRDDGMRIDCKDCRALFRVVYMYNIPMDELKELIRKANGKCQLCSKESALVIDHDHKCCPTRGQSCGKCVRGLICGNCNTGLGMFSDSTETLSAALTYLTSWDGVARPEKV